MECYPKASFITWLVIQNRLNTGDRLKLFGIAPVATCPLCHYHLEDHFYLYFNCLFPEKVWLYIKTKINATWPGLHWSDLVAHIAKFVRDKCWVFALCVNRELYQVINRGCQKNREAWRSFKEVNNTCHQTYQT